MRNFSKLEIWKVNLQLLTVELNGISIGW
jgi:hypothetical protein